MQLLLLILISPKGHDQSDFGNVRDGGGFPVFTFYSITSHEKFVEDLVQMFRLELCLKRLLGPVPPSFRAGKSDVISLRFDNQPNLEILQLAEANIDTLKVNEIFTVDGKEMHVSIV
ncbi:hypothetical protein V8G54_006136 [Vigna mungo]|uniref:Uncharacterized protein n=1 Tax=Vigna mungo TaxID=3915 RepID=A0AAQ3S7S0_VIGMU